MTRYARGYGAKKCKQEQTPTSWPLLKVQVTKKKFDEPKEYFSSGRRETNVEVAKTSSANESWFNFHSSSKNVKPPGVVKCDTDSSSSKNSGNLAGVKSSEGRGVSKGEIGYCQASAVAENPSDNKESRNGRGIPRDRKFASSFATRKHGKNIKSRANLSIEDLRDMRRKEKAHKREKKKVCFCCRRSGHQLADCPEFTPMGASDVAPPAGGLCYQCGSTEHNVNQCSRKGADSHKFARCFVCGEDGHLARHCQENPKGKYPKGGACRLCGATNHLCRECPTSVKKAVEKQDNIVWCTTEGPVESLPEDTRKVTREKNSSKKIIQF